MIFFGGGIILKQKGANGKTILPSVLAILYLDAGERIGGGAGGLAGLGLH